MDPAYIDSLLFVYALSIVSYSFQPERIVVGWDDWHSSRHTYRRLGRLRRRTSWSTLDVGHARNAGETYRRSTINYRTRVWTCRSRTTRSRKMKKIINVPGTITGHPCKSLNNQSYRSYLFNIRSSLYNLTCRIWLFAWNLLLITTIPTEFMRMRGFVLTCFLINI